MAKIKDEKLAKIIDTCIDASEKLDRIEIVVKGLKSEIDEISTTLFFHYKGSDE